jgi:hypothetical protein
MLRFEVRISEQVLDVLVRGRGLLHTDGFACSTFVRSSMLFELNKPRDL